MVLEAGEEDAVPWMAPVDADESLVMRFGSTTKLHHPGGANACLVDGSVRFLKTTTSIKVLRALMSIVGGDEVPKDW
jgi:prepilin-type processing-associated H-X9-DG protein